MVLEISCLDKELRKKIVNDN